MNQKSKFIFFFVLIIILLVSITGCYKTEPFTPVEPSTKSTLPDSFTINLHNGASSSGGDRYSTTTLKFNNGVIISGFYNYRYSSTTGNRGDFNCTLNINTFTWIVDNTNEKCEHYLLDVPLTKKELEEEINSGRCPKCSQEFYPMRGSCYELTE